MFHFKILPKLSSHSLRVLAPSSRRLYSSDLTVKLEKLRAHNFWPFETTVSVRGYELDSFQHLNNAVYFSYLEHARWELLQTVARVTESESMEQVLDNCLPVLRHTSMDFRRELALHDVVRISLTPTRVSESSFTLAGTISVLESPTQPASVGKVAATSEAVCVFVKRNVGKVPLAPLFRESLLLGLVHAKQPNQQQQHK